jgi:hypothetical protein
LQLLAADFLPEVWIPDPETRSRRAQVAHRAGLVQQRSRLRNRVEAVLHRNLLECPWTDTFGKRGCQWLAHLNLPPADREQLDSTLRQLDCIEAEVARADQLIAETTLGDPRIRRLMTIPGVGVTTAAATEATVFQGTTLRGMLLNAYGWWTFGSYALLAGWFLVIAGFVILLALLFEVWRWRVEARPATPAAVATPVVK